MKRFLLSAATLALVVGCAEHPDPVSVGTRTVGSGLSSMAADRPSEWEMTPEGWFLRECVHEIPNGASLDPDGVVHKNGKMYTIPQCPYTGSLARQVMRGAPTPSNPQGALVQYVYDSTGHSFEYLQALWVVPPPPAATFGETQVFYAWPGLESGIQSGNVLQPVMQYGYNGLGGGNNWSVAAWQCPLDGGNCNHSSLVSVETNHVIFGVVKLTSCAGSTCRWDVRATDETSNQVLVDDTFPDGNPPGYYWAYGGAMEGYNLTACYEYPPNGVFFTNIGEILVGDSVRTPSWRHGGTGSGCGFHVEYSSYYESPYVFLYDSAGAVPYSSPPPESVYVTVSGPDQVPAHHPCTWSAAAGGGTEPYVYSWLLNGSPVGGDSSTLAISTPGSQFTLSVVAVDSVGRANGRSMTVSVGGRSGCADNGPIRK